MERSKKLGLFIGNQMVVIPDGSHLPASLDYSKVRTEIWFEVSGTWDMFEDPENGEHLTEEVGFFPTPVSAQEALDEWKKTDALCPDCLKGKTMSRKPEKVKMEVPTIKELLVVFTAPKERRLRQKPRFVGI